MISTLNRKKLIELSYLCKPNSCMQLRNPVIVTNERVKVGATVNALVIVTMIAVTIRFRIYVRVIGHYRSAFRAGHRFYEIKRKCTGVTDRSKELSFIRRPDALTCIFKQ